MTKQKNKWANWIGLALALAMGLWVSYDLFFKYLINDSQARQIEIRLQENFKDNQSDFMELWTFSKQFRNMGAIEFYEDDQVYFQISDTLPDISNSDPKWIVLGKNAIDNISEIHFQNDNTIEIIEGDTVAKYNDWIIDYEGRMDNPLFRKLLAYNQISVKQLKALKANLSQINCFYYYQNEKIITIRYAGHWGEGFHYIIPLTEKVGNKNWKKLSANYYWEHYQNGFFCGWTDW